MTEWTDQMKLDVLMKMPWTVTREESDEPGEIILRVTELPETIVIGTPEEVAVEFWNALKATFEARQHFGDKIDLPASVRGRMPWEEPAHYESSVTLKLETAESTIATRSTATMSEYGNNPPVLAVA